MNIKHLPDLHESVISALDFFIKNTPPKLNLENTGQPFVVGSGNAYNAGKMLFSLRPAIFASESNFKQKLAAHLSLIKSGVIKRAIIISASGEKDAAWEVAEAEKYGLETTIMTCNSNSAGAKLADEVVVYRKVPEPQTYNISTYLGMLLSASDEKAKNIKDFIKKIKLPKDFGKYKAYAFIVPDEFSELTPMLDIKKHELFGPHLSIRSFSCGEARHAKFVMPWNEELVISLGDNKYFGLPGSRFKIKMPKKYGAGLVMALTYYLIGKIQAAKTPYYKKNIAKFCIEGPKAFGKKEPFDIIVPGNY
ncbi:MAG: hypothetical protein WCT50_04500 [Patescibacteria group bacterium]